MSNIVKVRVLSCVLKKDGEHFMFTVFFFKQRCRSLLLLSFQSYARLSYQAEKMIINNELSEEIPPPLNRKVALLNLWGTKNYGAILTSYGLQQFLSKHQYTSQLVRYIINSTLNQDDVFDAFALAELSLTPYIANYKDLSKLNETYDNFIVGSDQIWRGICTFYFDYFFYLDFVQTKKRKIACAASFGKNELGRLPIIVKNAAQLLKRFDHISVREKSGVDVCKRELSAQATHVLDPVFYLPVDKWSELADKATRDLPDKFVASYLLNASSVDATIAPLMGDTPVIDIVKNEKDEASVYSWLKAIRDCSCLITDSFHGMCFGLIFNKPLAIIANYQRGIDRFTSILEQLSLMDRMVDDISQVSLEFLQREPLDEERLKHLRHLVESSTQSLLHALEQEPKQVEIDIKALAKKDLLWHCSPSALWLLTRSLAGYFLGPKYNQWYHKEVYKDLKTRLRIHR